MAQQYLNLPENMVEYGNHEDALLNAPDLLRCNQYLSIWSYSKGNIVVFLMGNCVGGLARVTRFQRQRTNDHANNNCCKTEDHNNYIHFYMLRTKEVGRVILQEVTLVETWRHQAFMMNNIRDITEA